MKNDQYGFCLDIEGEVAKALDAPGRQLFIRHFQQLVEGAMTSQVAGSPKAIFEYEKSLRALDLAAERNREGSGVSV